MGQAWAALLGAFVGGFVTLAGALAVEFRRDRRRQIGAARLVLSQLARSAVELRILIERERDDGAWLEGPHRNIRTDAWESNGAEFVGRLSEREFGTVDLLHVHLLQASEWGLTRLEAGFMEEQADLAGDILRTVATPTWFDHHVWRL